MYLTSVLTQVLSKVAIKPMVKLHVRTQKNLTKGLIRVKPSTSKDPALPDQLDVANLAKMLLW